MQKMRLGRTDLVVSKCGFGCLPIQRVDLDTAKRILWKAYENGIDFYDTARAYTDSEEKIGHALAKVRSKIVIATKSNAKDRKGLLKDLQESLKRLQTDYVDILQLHNPDKLPDPNDQKSTYAGLLEAKEKGMTRFIGISNHHLPNANQAVNSGLYDTIQYPISYLADEKELHLIELCKKRDVGLIGMKALCGGLIINIKAAFAFLSQFDNLVPIWGIQKEIELDEFLQYEADPPELDESLLACIKQDRIELAGNFCRGCGYCLPCPAEIEIPTAARMAFLLGRAPYQQFLSEKWQNEMAKIENCIQCGACRSRCPYHLDTPELLRYMLTFYRDFSAKVAN